MTISRKLVQLARDECERQHVGPDRVVSLLDGYAFAVEKYDEITEHCWHVEDSMPTAEDMLELAGIVEPDSNGRFRPGPVTFDHAGLRPPPAREVPDQIERLFSVLQRPSDGGSLDLFAAQSRELKSQLLRQWIYSFLAIHPLSDGNGRTAWVLYNWVGHTLHDPLPLPYFDWSGDGVRST